MAVSMFIKLAIPITVAAETIFSLFLCANPQIGVDVY